MNPLAIFLVFDGGFNTKTTTQDFVELYMKKISELPKELFFHLLEEMKNHDIISYLETIKNPTLIVGGDKDKVIPNYLQQILHKKIENSELYIVKDGSHVPQVDFPEIINKRINRFLNKH
jgi:pimeloyl-ACP methyl ester carboxylesterase